MQRLERAVDEYQDPNDRIRSGDQSGADVVALCGGYRIGIQVTDLDTGEELGQARKNESRLVRDTERPGGTYFAWGQNDPGKVVAAIERSMTRKGRMSFAGFDEFWLLLCCGVPEATASTVVMTPWLDPAELDRATLDKLSGSKYSRAFIYAITGVEKEALYQWKRGDQWSESTLPVRHGEECPEFWHYKNAENEPELHSDPLRWQEREVERFLAEQADVDLYEMANLYPAETGLPMTVWVSPRGHARHDVRIKVCRVHGPRMTIDDTVVVAVRPTPRLVAGQLSPADMRLVADWLRLNEAALVDYWEGTIGTVELARRLRRLP